MCGIHRDMALPAIRFTFIATELYKGEMSARRKKELAEVIEDICSAKRALTPGQNGSVAHLIEYGWFLDWLKTEKFQSIEKALEALKKATSTDVLETKKSLLYRLFDFMATQASGAWHQQTRRECEGDD